MSASGLNGTNGVALDLSAKFANLNQLAAISREQPGSLRAGYETQIEHLHASISPIVERREHAVTRPEVESMSQSDSNTNFADLRAQLAEARSEGKLAEAIGKSNERHAEIVGRLDTGLAEIKGQIVAMNTRLEGIERITNGTKMTVILTGLTAVAVVITILAYGQSWFGVGISTRDAVIAEVTRMQQQTKPSVTAPP